MITVVSHDAGGAEILSNYVLQNPENYQFVLDGPAISVFRKLIHSLELTKLENTVNNTDLYITGTSWQSEIEKKAISLAKEKNIKVVSYLDHWVNYKDRFIFESKLILPDEIWVGDEEAFQIAKNTFPESNIVLIRNPYFDSLHAFFERNRPNDEQKKVQNVLFICENISDHAKKMFHNERHWGYTETDAIRYFFLNLEKLNINKANFIFRPHPSDLKGKYDWVLNEYNNYSILISNEIPLFEQIAKADIVVGCESMALVVALLADKKVVSCIPPEGKSLELPQRDIIELRRMQIGDFI